VGESLIEARARRPQNPVGRTRCLGLVLLLILAVMLFSFVRRLKPAKVVVNGESHTKPSIVFLPTGSGPTARASIKVIPTLQAMGTKLIGRPIMALDTLAATSPQ